MKQTKDTLFPIILTIGIISFIIIVIIIVTTFTSTQPQNKTDTLSNTRLREVNTVLEDRMGSNWPLLFASIGIFLSVILIWLFQTSQTPLILNISDNIGSWLMKSSGIIIILLSLLVIFTFLNSYLQPNTDISTSTVSSDAMIQQVQQNNQDKQTTIQRMMYVVSFVFIITLIFFLIKL